MRMALLPGIQTPSKANLDLPTTPYGFLYRAVSRPDRGIHLLHADPDLHATTDA